MTREACGLCFVWCGSLVLGVVFVSHSSVCRLGLCFGVQVVFFLVSLVFCVQSNNGGAQPFCVAVIFIILSLFFCFLVANVITSQALCKCSYALIGSVSFGTVPGLFVSLS